MLKKYSWTDMVWDTETLKWFRPFKKPSKEKTEVVVIENWWEGDFSKLSWRQFLFRIYKNCRSGVGWPTIYNTHDEDDKQYFDMLDKICR